MRGSVVRRSKPDAINGEPCPAREEGCVGGGLRGLSVVRRYRATAIPHPRVSASAFHPLPLNCRYGHEAASLLASAAGAVVLSEGIYVTLAVLHLSLSPAISFAQISAAIPPCVSSGKVDRSCTSHAYFSSSLLCAASSSFFVCYIQSPVYYLAASHALRSSVSPFLIAASFVSPHQVPVGEIGVVVMAQLLIDYFCVK